MTMKVGNLDVVDTLINSELRIMTLERIIDLLIIRTAAHISQAEIDKIRAEITDEIIKKYPELGIKKK